MRQLLCLVSVFAMLTAVPVGARAEEVAEATREGRPVLRLEIEREVRNGRVVF